MTYRPDTLFNLEAIKAAAKHFGTARGECRKFLCILSKRDGEFRVRPQWDDREEAIYYTPDLEDAVVTAHMMWQHMNDTMVYEAAVDALRESAE